MSSSEIVCVAGCVGVSEEVSSFRTKKEVSVRDDDENTSITFSTAQCSIE